MKLTFRETDGITGNRLTLGDAAIPDGSYLKRDGKNITGDAGISGAVQHNLTTGKQGGQAGEYYHFTASEYSGNWAKDLYFTGDGTGLLYGSCYGNHIAWVQAAAAQNTWYNISNAGMISGELNNVTHDGNGKLTIAVAGRYIINYSLCFENNVANDHVEGGIEINNSGAAEAAGQCHLENKFANEQEHMGSGAILDLAATNTIEMAIRTIDANTPNFTVHAVNITIIQVGGT